MARLLRGGIGSGTLSAAIDSTQTTIAAGILANVEAVSGGDTMTFRLGAPGPNEELVQLTAHTLSSTSGTFTRGTEGTDTGTPDVDGRAWPIGTPIEHVATVTDWAAALAGGAGGGTKSADDPSLYTLAGSQTFLRDGVTSLPTGASWVNQGTASYREEYGAGIITTPADAALNLRGLVWSLPSLSDPWTIIAKTRVATQSGTFVGGMWLRDSASGELVTFGWNNNNRPVAQAWTDPNTFSANIIDITTHLGLTMATTYYKIIHRSSSDVEFYVSPDGRAWWLAFDAYNIGAFMTPDEYGFFGEVRHSVVSEISCQHLFLIDAAV